MTIEPREHLRPIYRTAERHEGRAEFVCLDRNERASPLPAAVFRDMLASVSMRDLMSYPDAGALVSRLAHALRLPEDWIAETAGSDNAIRRTFMAYLRPGAGVVAPSPSYAMYEIYMRIFQGIPRPVAYSAERRLDVDAFVAAIAPGVGIVVLANPDQPMGAALPEAEVERIIARAAAVDAVCLVDEAYHPFHAETVLPLVRRFDNLIVLRTFSKYPGCAGIRLGYAAGCPHLIAGLMKVRGGNEVSGISLALGSYLLDHPEIAEDFRHAVDAGRRILNAQAEALGFATLPCAGNFQLLRCPARLSAAAVAVALKDRGFLVKAGFDHPAIADCIRVSLNGADIMQPFAAVLAEAVGDLRGRVGDASA
jgi:histidinol-phosphate aminotransferase